MIVDALLVGAVYSDYNQVCAMLVLCLCCCSLCFKVCLFCLILFLLVGILFFLILSF